MCSIQNSLGTVIGFLKVAVTYEPKVSSTLLLQIFANLLTGFGVFGSEGFHSVWPVKSRQMSIRVAQNDFTGQMKDFDTPLQKIA